MMLRIASLICISLAVNIYISVAPSILGALVDYQGLASDIAGRLIAYNFWGAAVATFLAIFILHRPGWNIRGTLLLSLLAIVLTSAASVWFAGDIVVLGLVRFVNGLGAGLGFTACCIAVIGTPNIERSYALMYGLPFMVSGVGLAFLPAAYQAVGIEGVFYGMGLLNVLACALLPFVPRTSATMDSATSPATSHPRSDRVLLMLSGIVVATLFLHYVFNSGIWTYFERVGVASGMSAERAGELLGRGMTAAIVGMIAASSLGGKAGYFWPVYMGFTVILFATLALLFSSSEIIFAVATAAFNASITFVTPYFVAILATLVPSGLGVTAANISTIAGFSTGPFLISYLIAEDDFDVAILVTAAGFCSAFFLFVFFVSLLRRSPTAARRIELATASTPLAP